MNLEEDYDHSWIHKELGTEKSSCFKKACDNGYAKTVSLKSPGAKPEKKSKVRMDSEVKLMQEGSLSILLFQPNFIICLLCFQFVIFGPLGFCYFPI